MSNSVWPHRWQPNRLLCPWDSPGKNTGVGGHFLLQCMKVKSESEVAQSCPTLSDPMDCSLPGSSIHGIFQARLLEWGAIAFSFLSIILFKILAHGLKHARRHTAILLPKNWFTCYAKCWPSTSGFLVIVRAAEWMLTLYWLNICHELPHGELASLWVGRPGVRC